MAESDKQLELLKQHLDGAGVRPACPSCGNTRWQFAGLAAMHVLAEAPGVNHLGPGILPVVNLMCGKCFLVRQYAWEAIKQAMSGHAETLKTQAGSAGEPAK